MSKYTDPLPDWQIRDNPKCVECGHPLPYPGRGAEHVCHVWCEVRCMDCDAFVGWKKFLDDGINAPSHGICTSCDTVREQKDLTG